MASGQLAEVREDSLCAAVTSIIERDDLFEVQVDAEKLQTISIPGASTVAGVLDAHKQAVEGLARRRLNVAEEDHFILRSVTFKPEGDHSDMRSATLGQIRVDVPKALVRSRVHGSCYAIAGDFISYLGAEPFARGGGAGLFIDSDGYEALRAGNEARYWGYPKGRRGAIAPELVGLVEPAEVLIRDVEDGHQAVRCRIDPTSDPRFFDRPLDHYPGLLMAAAARQLAVFAASRRSDTPPAQWRSASEAHDFLAFVELGTPPLLRAEIISSTTDSVCVRVAVSQSDVVRATSLFTFTHGKAQSVA